MRKEKGEIFKTRKKGNNKDEKQYRRKKEKGIILDPLI